MGDSDYQWEILEHAMFCGTLIFNASGRYYDATFSYAYVGSVLLDLRSIFFLFSWVPCASACEHKHRFIRTNRQCIHQLKTRAKGERHWLERKGRRSAGHSVRSSLRSLVTRAGAGQRCGGQSAWRGSRGTLRVSGAAGLGGWLRL